MQCSTLVPSPSVHKADPSHCLTVWTRDYHSLVCASVFPSLFPLLCLGGGKRGSDGERERGLDVFGASVVSPGGIWWWGLSFGRS